MVNKLVLGTTVGLVVLSGCNYAVANDCDYTKKVNTQWTQEIQKTENIERNVFPYVEDTRKCVMTMDVTVDGSIYPAEGSYVFGPDMTENAACDNATVNAKKSIISQVSPEVLSANTDMVCKSEDLPKVIAAPQPEVNIVQKPIVIAQNNTVQGEWVDVGNGVTERIISSKVVDNYPNNVVYSNNNNNWGNSIVTGTSNVIGGIFNSIGGVVVTVKTRERGTCYANWKTGGRDCY